MVVAGSKLVYLTNEISTVSEISLFKILVGSDYFLQIYLCVCLYVCVYTHTIRESLNTRVP